MRDYTNNTKETIENVRVLCFYWLTK